jgi:hypothetical protein
VSATKRAQVGAASVAALRSEGLSLSEVYHRLKLSKGEGSAGILQVAQTPSGLDCCKCLITRRPQSKHRPAHKHKLLMRVSVTSHWPTLWGVI